MQIHELNNFTGTLGSGAYLAVDDGNDTGKLSTQQLLSATEARIDNIIAGPAPSAEEIVDARLGADGVTYPSLGDAIRDQVSDLKTDLETTADLVGTCTNCYINRYSHAEVESANWLTSDYIPVEAGKTYYLTGATQSGFGYDSTLNVYNTSKTFLGVQTSTYDNTAWTASQNGYIRVTNYSSSVKPRCIAIAIVVNDRLDALESDVNSLDSDISNIATSLESSENFVGDCTAVYINRYSHEESSSSKYKTSDYIPVKAGATYYLTANHQADNAYDSSLNVYDTNKDFLGYQTSTYNNTAWTATYDGYIRVTSYDAADPKCIGEVNNVVNNINSLESKVNKFEGKTIIWFGTSIPAGQKTTEVTVDGITCNNNYPEMVGKLLNCYVINHAIGTSCAKTGKPEKVSDADPLGIKGIHYEIATRALTETLAEKQDFVNNWATKYAPGGTLELYDAPSTLSQYQQDIILSSSYETLLTPYIDGTYPMPDIFVFDHGYNDGAYFNASTGADMSIIPNDPTDRHYYIGALNMLFQMILAENPKAKILLIDHFCSQDRPWVVDAQKVVSEEWEFPTCELYKFSGISMQEIDVSGVDTPIKNVYCPDGTHPHSDSTGSTNMMLARKLVAWMNTIM